jgi:magnesium transporter
MLLDNHLMGRTILDMDGRQVEVVNDVHLLESRHRLLLVHVDTSLNGLIRRWGLGGLRWIKDEFISWKYVQPLSVEDAVTTDKVSLSVTRRQLRELPSEDLADALEELSGPEQAALFSALDSEKAAETLVEAEPRAQRQLIANLRQERARTILSEMSVPQLADLFSVLPLDDMTQLMQLLPRAEAERIRSILSEREATAEVLMSSDFVSVAKESCVGEVLAGLRASGRDPEHLSYIYVVNQDGKTLVGVVDLRELVLAPDTASMGEIMTAPVVTAEVDDLKEDLAQIFAKYHYRMIPVADAQDSILGVIRYKDIMKGIRHSHPPLR